MLRPGPYNRTPWTICSRLHLTSSYETQQTTIVRGISKQVSLVPRVSHGSSTNLGLDSYQGLWDPELSK